MMIELTSTPIILMVILGVAGMIIPVINVLRRERGSSTFYGAIAFGALLLALGFKAISPFLEDLIKVVRMIGAIYFCLLYTSPSPRDS